MKKKIYLYVKESPLGLKYLGQTIKNPYKYPGSGLYWKRHLKKYKFKHKDIKTIILLETYNKTELSEKGVYYSNLWDVVNSKKWANLIIENGKEGPSGLKQTKEALQHSINVRAKKVINKKTKVIYNTIVEAAKLSNIPIGEFAYKIRRYNSIFEYEFLDNSINLKYIEKYKKSRYDLTNRKYIKLKQKHSSKYVGVSFEKTRNKWKATIMVDKKLKYLGRFNSEVEAANAYKEYINNNKNEI